MGIKTSDKKLINNDFLDELLKIYQNEKISKEIFDKSLREITQKIIKKLAACYLILPKDNNDFNIKEKLFFNDESLIQKIYNYNGKLFNFRKVKCELHKLRKLSNSDYYIVKVAQEFSSNKIINILSIKAIDNQYAADVNSTLIEEHSKFLTENQLIDGTIENVEQEIDRLKNAFFNKDIAQIKIKILETLIDQLEKLPTYATEKQIAASISLWLLRGDFISKKTNQTVNNNDLLAKSRFGLFSSQTRSQAALISNLIKVGDSADIVTNQIYRTARPTSAA